MIPKSAVICVLMSKTVDLNATKNETLITASHQCSQRRMTMVELQEKCIVSF